MVALTTPSVSCYLGLSGRATLFQTLTYMSPAPIFAHRATAESGKISEIMMGSPYSLPPRMAIPRSSVSCLWKWTCKFWKDAIWGVVFWQICAYNACFAPSSTPKHQFFVKEYQLCCTSLRDLIKDALLRDRKRRKKPTTLRESNPWPQEFCYAGPCSIAAMFKLLFWSNSWSRATELE